VKEKVAFLETINNVCRMDDLSAAIPLLSITDGLLVATKAITKQHSNLKMFQLDETFFHPDSSIVVKQSLLIIYIPLSQRNKLFCRRGVDSNGIIEIFLGRAHFHRNRKTLK